MLLTGQTCMLPLGYNSWGPCCAYYFEPHCVVMCWRIALKLRLALTNRAHMLYHEQHMLLTARQVMTVPNMLKRIPWGKAYGHTHACLSQVWETCPEIDSPRPISTYQPIDRRGVTSVLTVMTGALVPQSSSFQLA